MRNNKRFLGFFYLFTILTIFAIISIFILSSVLNIIPSNLILIAYACIIIAIGIIATNFVIIAIRSKFTPFVGSATVEKLVFGIEITGYALIAIIALAILQVNLEGLILGGTFTGLVLGLAAQTSLSNIFGGIALIFSKPFIVGDRVTISTWQYGMMAPMYPPKFWSNDFLIPGYTGTITGISLMHSTIKTDDNVILKIPNNILIQAAILIHNENYRLVRTKYEIHKNIDPEVVIPLIRDEMKKLDFILKDPEVKILDTTLSTYIIVIDAMCKGQYEEPPRSEIIKKIMKIMVKIEGDTVT